MRRVVGPDEVLAEVRRRIDVAGSHSFIISLGSPLTPRTSFGRVRLVTERARKFSTR